MNLNLSSSLADKYNSNSQKIRVLTESWVHKYIYCPSCGNAISEYENNKPVADFHCSKCSEDYELKSKQGTMGKKIVDGAYGAMITRLQSDSNPNFFFLNYDKTTLDIINFMVIAKHFFTPEMIEKRKPLSPTARRAGWIGCNILLDVVPDGGKIFYIKNGQKESKNKIMNHWQKTSFLKQSTNVKAKGWLLDIMKCIDRLNKKNFNLLDMYQFEKYLKLKHPENNNIQAKIRQQLQLLRDKEYIHFESRGRYKLRE